MVERPRTHILQTHSRASAINARGEIECAPCPLANVGAGTRIWNATHTHTRAPTSNGDRSARALSIYGAHKRAIRSASSKRKHSSSPPPPPPTFRPYGGDATDNYETNGNALVISLMVQSGTGLRLPQVWWWVASTTHPHTNHLLGAY